TARPQGEADREERPDHHRDPEPIPVADRPGQAVRSERVIASDPPGEEPRRERVGPDERDAAEYAAEQLPCRATAGKDERRADAGKKDDPPLALDHRLCHVTRPCDRNPPPCGETGKRDKEARLDPAQRNRGPESQPDSDHPTKCEGAPTPGDGKEAAVSRREGGDRRRGADGNCKTLERSPERERSSPLDERSARDDHIVHRAGLTSGMVLSSGASGASSSRRSFPSARCSATSTVFVLWPRTSPICRAVRSAP